MSTKHSTLSPTLYQVLQIAKMGVPVTPTEINDHIGKGNYASKHVLYLKILGYDFTTVKSGQSVVSYTLIKVPDNHNDLIDYAINKKSKLKSSNSKIVKAPKTKKILVVPSNLETAITGIGPKVVDIDAVKAKNLETMKKVAAKFKSKKVSKSRKAKVREFDDVTEQFGTSGEVGTSFNVDRDWDSVEGLDLSKLL